jgi:hypothetical protein
MRAEVPLRALIYPAIHRREELMFLSNAGGRRIDNRWPGESPQWSVFLAREIAGEIVMKCRQIGRS